MNWNLFWIIGDQIVAGGTLDKGTILSGITEQGKEAELLVERGNNLVFSQSYRMTREVFMSKLEAENAKWRAKARSEKARGRNSEGYRTSPAGD